MTALPQAFLDRPLAHRGLHDERAGIIENSPSAMAAAVAHGYGIELDVQVTRDGEALVFHDARLERLTGQDGLVRDHTLAEMTRFPLLGGDEPSASLRDVLAMVDGRVPVLIELKSQPSEDAPEDGTLARAVARALSGYDGLAATMCFNPQAVAPLRQAAPDRALGLVTEDFSTLPYLSAAQQDHLNNMTDFDAVGASFISHDCKSLHMAPVQSMKARGVPVLTWTIKSPEDAQAALKTADNITFEGYLP
ncbi:glycerophosphodiester phosphodiesterase family protein [Dinoroseobacter sp. S375]|uniref:glycerophosphodiester phosphodiesterase family protein n=1 Tax=Dinoroseobacter sp. S375 TaxID=3415136 RepID=UPI003C7C4076